MTSQCSAAVAAALAALLVLRRRAGSSAALTAADFSEIASASAPLPSDAAELSALLLAERRAHARTEKRRIDERKGRRKAEMAVQKAALQSCGSLPEARYPILPIGTVRSCFIECGGVPRQAGLASETRAVIQFNPNVGPGSFDGLDLHSHVWVLFVFHHNTNAAKIARAHSVKGATFPSKITPPRAGKKIGVLATRTPHRPNPVGLTLCKLEAVDCMKRRVVLRGSDLVDGTPILDVKPYLPFADTPRESEGEVRIPAWTAAFQPPREVRVEAAAEVQLASSAVAAALRVFQGDAPRLRRALLQVLAVDVGRKPRQMPYITLFDGVAVHYTVAVGAEGGGDEEAVRGLTVIQQVLPHYGDKTGAARPLAVVPDALRVGGSART